MELDATFSADPLSKWEFTQSYRDGQKRVTTMAAVNDAAERGEKLALDFLKSSKREESYQKVFQVVELH